MSEVAGFAEQLRITRKRKGLKQVELAEALGVSIDTVRRWEAGSFEPRVSDLRNLATVLGVSASELLGEKAMLTIQRGDMRLEIPATPEGFAFLEGKMREFTAAESLPGPSQRSDGERSA